MKYFRKLEGERVYLSPMNPDDAEIYTKWMNDPEVSGYLGNYWAMVSLPVEREFLANAAKGNGSHIYGIVLRDGDRLIGNIGLKDIHPTYRTATLGIFIGEAEDRSKGYGAEAIRLLADYGFRWLGLRNIDLHVNSNNPRAIRCYEKAGFREYGRRHGAVYADGRFIDDVAMELTAAEWLPQTRT